LPHPLTPIDRFLLLDFLQLDFLLLDIGRLPEMDGHNQKLYAHYLFHSFRGETLAKRKIFEDF
jgi:hypothetical protein